MVKLRAVYSKSKESMFLSHLDIIGVFEKTFRRANIPLEYSKGYNPRPEIVFAHPLSVGIESKGEIFEAILVEELPIAYLVRELNKVLPVSITILSAEYINLSEKSIMSRVYAATYTIEICYSNVMLLGKDKRQIENLKMWYKLKLSEYLEQDFLLVIKKSTERIERIERIDIKPMIISYDFLLDGNLEITVNAGSKSNLKPDIIMSGFCEYISQNLEYNIKREKILFN
ncbi:MAG: TIGR03936 family radical SAM-associated protein [Clostridia bacterium]|nr:TIGR03936 family radical SAM-associated protein [Clostridia bacterium]MDD4386729.1 TIGR03936 family radical SAM-associated protein [Clostridia bacterium]